MKTFTQSQMWQHCKENARIGRDINSGGLGRIKVGNKVYVGGFFLNLVMLYRPEESLAKCSPNQNKFLPTTPFELSAEEFAEYINR